MLDKKLPRRDLLKGAIAGLAAIPVVAVVGESHAQAAKAAPKMLDVNDPQAKALGYVIDTAKVDQKANPLHKPGQRCDGCVQWQGKPTDKTAPCAIFVGKAVVGAGWCKVWAKKP
ncbi:MAG: high-potential iron-sulfur protein [Steroidobacteraceae bacterium]|nr:high-potential iron-sulfur protein [Steroidobacteraceae bacterium]